MRRKPNTLIPFELAILATARRLGGAEFHGFTLAKALGDGGALTAGGALYKALRRLERAGLLASRWEDPAVAAGENRPRRRYYHLTAPLPGDDNEP